MPKRRQSILDILDSVAKEFKIPPKLFRAVAEIESSFNPRSTTGSYSGVFQISKGDFNKYGGGNIFDPEDNARAAAKKWKSDARYFKKHTGRDPSATDMYMMHQQGRAGYTAHKANPEGVAWKNILPYYTKAEAKRRGFSSREAYAQAAVWGNIPRSQKRQFAGGVDDVTSGDFARIWNARVQRGLERQGGASGAPPLPQESPGRLPGRRSQAFPLGGPAGNLPEDRGFVGTSSQGVPPPSQGARPRQKMQDRFMPDFQTTVEPVPGLAPPIPERSPGAQASPSAGGSSQDLNRVFGEPFGDLFRNKADVGALKGSLPAPPPSPPMFRNFFLGLFSGN